MEKRFKAKRSFFEKFFWFDFAVTIAVVILGIVLTIYFWTDGDYIWSIFFGLVTLFYIIVGVPVSWKLMQRTKETVKELEKVEKRINRMIEEGIIK